MKLILFLVACILTSCISDNFKKADQANKEQNVQRSIAQSNDHLSASAEELTEQSLTLDQFINCIDRKKISQTKSNNNFEVYYSDPVNQIVKSVSSSDGRGQPPLLKYNSYHKEGKRDTLFLNGNPIPLKFPLDKNLLKNYFFNWDGKDFFLLISPSLTASGSFAQLRGFTLIEHKNYEITQQYYFVSRFGTLDNLADFDNDGKLDFLQIQQDGQGDLTVKVFSLKDSEVPLTLERFSAKLKYLGNDKFLIRYNKFKRNC